MTIAAHHNPDCCTSRTDLAIIGESGVEPVAIEYLQTGWTQPQPLGLFAAENLTPRSALRTTKSPAELLGLRDVSVADEALPDATIAHPALVNRAIVGSPTEKRPYRPSETVLDLLKTMPTGALYKEDGQMILNEKGSLVD